MVYLHQLVSNLSVKSTVVASVFCPILLLSWFTTVLQQPSMIWIYLQPVFFSFSLLQQLVVHFGISLWICNYCVGSARFWHLLFQFLIRGDYSLIIVIMIQVLIMTGDQFLSRFQQIPMLLFWLWRLQLLFLFLPMAFGQFGQFGIRQQQVMALVLSFDFHVHSQSGLWIHQICPKHDFGSLAIGQIRFWILCSSNWYGFR